MGTEAKYLKHTEGTLPDETWCAKPLPGLMSSAADRKDGPELPLDLGGTKALLAADAVYAFPSPYLQLNRKLSPRKVINGEDSFVCEYPSNVEPESTKR